MGTDHNGFSHAAQILQKFFHLHTRTRVQTGIRFIQHQKGRIVDECPCHTQPLLHSAGKRIHINLFFVGQIDQLEQIIGYRGDLPGSHTVHGTVKIHIFADF